MLINFHSSLQGRARAQNAKFFLLVEGPNMSKFQEDLDRYKGIENVSTSSHRFVWLIIIIRCLKI